MEFSRKTWVDRMAEYINRRTLTKEDGSTELVTVARSEGMISQEGDAFNAETMNDLEQRIADGFDSVNSDLADLNTNLTPEDGGSKSRMGQLMIDSIAGSFSDSASKSFTLSHTPINNYAVLCTAVTSPSTNIALKNIVVSGKTLTINLTGVTGNVRFAVLYMTKDEIS